MKYSIFIIILSLFGIAFALTTNQYLLVSVNNTANLNNLHMDNTTTFAGNQVVQSIKHSAVQAGWTGYSDTFTSAGSLNNATFYGLFRSDGPGDFLRPEIAMLNAANVSQNATNASYQSLTASYVNKTFSFPNLNYSYAAGYRLRFIIYINSTNGTRFTFYNYNSTSNTSYVAINNSTSQAYPQPVLTNPATNNTSSTNCFTNPNGQINSNAPGLSTCWFPVSNSSGNFNLPGSDNGGGTCKGSTLFILNGTATIGFCVNNSFGLINCTDNFTFFTNNLPPNIPALKIALENGTIYTYPANPQALDNNSMHPGAQVTDPSGDDNRMNFTVWIGGTDNGSFDYNSSYSPSSSTIYSPYWFGNLTATTQISIQGISCDLLNQCNLTVVWNFTILCSSGIHTITALPASLFCSNTTYNTSGSITIDSSNAITIAAENITVDCGGFDVNTTTTGEGIYSDQNGTRVRNCNVNATGSGIHFVNSAYGEINNSKLFSSNSNGISLEGASNGNQISNSSTTRFYLNGASNNSLSQLSINGSSGTVGDGAAITFDPGSENNTLTDSNITPAAGFVAIDMYSAIGNLFLRNNVTGDLWVSDDTGGNFFSDVIYGNIWNYANGTGAWVGRNILAAIGNPWAIAGSDIPISSTTFPTQWIAFSNDSHPYTLNFLPSAIPVCGNGICEAGEDYSTCPADCTPGNSGNIQPGQNITENVTEIIPPQQVIQQGVLESIWAAFDEWASSSTEGLKNVWIIVVIAFVLVAFCAAYYAYTKQLASLFGAIISVGTALFSIWRWAR